MSDAPASLNGLSAAEGIKPVAGITKSARVLVVDDEDQMRGLCRRALAGEGVVVETASGPEEALALLRLAAFDILITDMQMGDSRAGVSLTEEARSRWPETDILIITGQPTLETAISTLKTGAADYLVKPFSVSQLRTVVKRLLRMRRLRRELEREKVLYRKLADDYEVLQKVERLKSGLIGRVSHELLTPVTVAFMAAEAVKDKISPSGLPVYLKLEGALKRMQVTVEDLLLFSRTQDAGFKIVKSSADLWPVLEGLLAGYRPFCEERGLKVEIKLEGEKRSLLADAELMKAVFSQLLLNAIRFNRKGGSLGVLARYEPEQTLFVFSDTGEGIAPLEQNLIFGGLYQVADYLTRKVGGLGVGLAIVRRIVEAHGGKISVKSVPGEGSVFTIILSKPR